MSTAGTVAGAVASGRVPIGNAEGDPITTWVNPISLLIVVRVLGVGAVVAVIWGWGAAQYPYLLLEKLDEEEAEP